jgi:hypothetical protein
MEILIEKFRQLTRAIYLENVEAAMAVVDLNHRNIEVYALWFTIGATPSDVPRLNSKTLSCPAFRGMDGGLGRS